ncbi:MAG: tandem-95 repeat protein [Actinobacteria bacterium]|nr:tandem-95 repeat protein [Actinomycetota bacterium]
MNDGTGGTDTAMVTIAVAAPPNRPPVAVDDGPYTIAEDTVLTVPAPGLLANDSDPDTNTLSAGSPLGGGGFNRTGHGAILLSPNGSFSYAPDADFAGTDTYIYRASDGSGGTADATVTFTVTPVNDAPVAGDDAYTTAAGTPLAVGTPGVLSNDIDVDADTLSANSPSDPPKGSVTLNADGSFTYTPDGGFNGTDTFTYAVGDGNGGLDTATVTVTVTPPPDLGRPQLSVTDVQVDEGGGPTVFTVTRSGDDTGVATVKVKTSGGTATVGADYVPVPLTTLTFDPDETAKQVTLVPEDDNLPEGNETLNLVLSAPTGAVIADATGLATIRANDGIVTLSVNDVSVMEGNSDTATATFTVTRRMDPSSSASSSVRYTTKAGTASTSDFTPVPSAVLDFAPGEFSKPVTVSVTGDTVDEANERFTLNLSAPVGATIADAVGTATIVDDDGSISPGPATFLSINDVRVQEKIGGESNTFFHEVDRSGDLSGSSTVMIKTSGGTATAADDYGVITLTTLTFGPGDSAKTFPVTFVDNNVPEADETFNVVLSAPTGAVLSDASGKVTIADDDYPSYLSVNNITFAERNEGTTTATFTVTRSGNIAGAATVKYKTGLGTATAGGDYTAVPLTVLTFAPGEASRSVSVDVTGDTLVEKNETFTLVLTAPSGATISDATGLATIVNDDL